MPKTDEVEIFKAKLEWYFPENLIRRYATNMLVQVHEREFIISFFEAYPPVLFGSPKKISKESKKVDTVRANCVASIVVSAEKIPSFIGVLQEVYDRHQESSPSSSEKKTKGE
jgi:adenosine/AMP kinase